MIELTKREGQALIKKIPQFVFHTVHKRHYYMTDCEKANAYLARYRKEEENGRSNSVTVH